MTHRKVPPHLLILCRAHGFGQVWVLSAKELRNCPLSVPGLPPNGVSLKPHTWGDPVWFTMFFCERHASYHFPKLGTLARSQQTCRCLFQKKIQPRIPNVDIHKTNKSPTQKTYTNFNLQNEIDCSAFGSPETAFRPSTTAENAAWLPVSSWTRTRRVRWADAIGDLYVMYELYIITWIKLNKLQGDVGFHWINHER